MATESSYTLETLWKARTLVNNLVSEPELKSLGTGEAAFIFLHKQYALKTAYLVMDINLFHKLCISNLIWKLKHCLFLLPLFCELRQWNKAWFIRSRLPEDFTVQTASSAAYYCCSHLTQIHSDAECSLQDLDTVTYPLEGKMGGRQDKTQAFLWCFLSAYRKGKQFLMIDRNIYLHIKTT